MPTPDDIARWCDEAKVLRAAVVAGEEAACSRVLAAHPKYIGRSRERLQTNRLRFSLRDAQWTIAREHGSETWSALCDQGRRWPRRTGGSQQGRAVRLAAERGDGHCGPEHLLMALAAPKQPTIASAVLEFVGADIASLLLDVLGRRHPPGTEHWGFNYSKHNPDEACIISEDEIDIEAIVHEALGDEAVYRLEPFAQARAAESWSGTAGDGPSDND
jgi:hypothetical protein